MAAKQTLGVRTTEEILNQPKKMTDRLFYNGTDDAWIGTQVTACTGVLLVCPRSQGAWPDEGRGTSGICELGLGKEGGGFSAWPFKVEKRSEPYWSGDVR